MLVSTTLTGSIADIIGDAFRTCAELRGWEEEGAWACYRTAPATPAPRAE
jgi:hypothetical protein